MEAEVKTQKCIADGLEHSYEFLTAAHGYQCFACRFCGDWQDVIEDSQP